jgi:WD40 repeat protein
MRIYTKGFIVAGSKGQILVYEKTDEPKQPYNRVATLPENAISKKTSASIMQQMCSHSIKNIDLCTSEDTIIFSTENGQLFKMSINLERPTDEVEYDYLVHSFHSRPINGMDVCIKKPLIATCSSDKTVKVWSYRPQGGNSLSGFSLEVDQSF